MAGRPDVGRISGLRHFDDISFETRDGRVLRGYRLNAADQAGQPVDARGYLLIMQGNAILADQIIGEFSEFARSGVDVYVYDYRGYGRSGGRRRLRAIVSDYGEIIDALNARGYRQHYVYAMSFGGIVLLNGDMSLDSLTRLIIDSTPARLSDYGCPPEYDPVNHLPNDCRHCLFITGEQDRVVSMSMSRELVDEAEQRGASLHHDAVFAHPFMDRNRSVHQRRMRLIHNYLFN
jgi:pimeloyl-ACP methyl ester carboxylesterase